MPGPKKNASRPTTGRDEARRDPRDYVPGKRDDLPERPAVLASFETLESAQRAQDSLEAKGFECQLDRVDLSPSDMSDLDDEPFPVSLTGEVGDSATLSSMSPDVSGLTDTGYDDPNVLLTVVLNQEDQRQQAEDLIESHGGRL